MFHLVDWDRILTELATSQLAAVIVHHDQWSHCITQLKAYLKENPAAFAATRWLVISNGEKQFSSLCEADPNIPEPLRKVELVVTANRGYGAAVNEAMHRTQEPFLLALNADIVPEPGFLAGVQRIVGERLHSQHPEKIGVLGFRLLNTDGTIQGSVGRFPSLYRLLSGLLRSREKRKYVPIEPDRVTDVPWNTGACVLLDRKCFDELEGFDERFFMYYEDVDYCLRATQKGWRVSVEPRLSVRHLEPYHLRPLTYSMAAMARRAMLFHFWKNRPRWEYWSLTRIVLFECRYRRYHEGWRDIYEMIRLFLRDPAHHVFDMTPYSKWGNREARNRKRPMVQPAPTADK